MSLREIPVLDDSADYSTWKKKVLIWQLGTAASVKQQASKLIMNMKGKPQEVSINIPIDVLGAEDGVVKLIAELDKLYKKDGTQSLFKAIDDFERYRRGDGEDIDNYILEFQRRYQILKQLRENKELYDDMILAYRLLNQASLNDEQARLVRATCTSTLSYNLMQEQLKRTFGDGFTRNENQSSLPFKSTPMEVVKQEPVFLTEDQQMGSDVHWTRNGDHQRNFTGQPMRGENRYNPYGQNRGQSRFNPYTQKRGQKSYMRGSSNQRISCFICHQPGHVVAECSFNTFAKSHQKQDDESRRKVYALFESDFSLPDCEEEIIYLTGECTNKALIDTGACATICGKEWFTVYESSLTTEERKLIQTETTERTFRFGDGKPVKSIALKTIPINLCNKDMFLKTYVVTNDIPLLLAKQTMTKMGMVLDMENMTLKIKDSKTLEKLRSTKSGHVAVPIARCGDGQESGVTYQVSEEQDCGKTADFYHRYYAHASAAKIGKVIKNAKLKDGNKIIEELEKIDQTCDFCLKYKTRSIPKRKVGIPQASIFNEVVAMDLKIINDEVTLLHMVDTVTRYSVAARVISKEAQEILDKVFKHWISIFGPPSTFISDNGGEFVNDCFNQACSVLNIKIQTSPAYSPWCNGIVERHNGILGCMIKSLLEEMRCDPEIAIAWSVSAKNSLSNTYGFSPHQLVFGTNPRVPGIMEENMTPGTLNHEGVLKIVSDHLNALSLARLKFVELEANDKLKRALQQRIFPQANYRYCSGDLVYFKRSKKFWYGPATVIGQVANQVLIKHGGHIVRVHPCKVVLKSRAKEQIEGSGATLQGQGDVGKPTIISESDYRAAVEEVRPGENTTQSIDFDDIEDEDEEVPVTTVQTLVEDRAQSIEYHDTVNVDDTANIDVSSITDVSAEATETETSTEVDEANTETDNSIWNSISGDSTKIRLIRGDVIRFRSEDEEPWKYGMIEKRAGKTSECSRNSFQIEQDLVEEPIIVDLEKHHVEKQEGNQRNTTVLLTQEDAEPYIFAIGIQDSKKIDVAKEQELKRLSEFGVYQETKDTGQSHVSSRWVVTTKGENDEQVKARLVARGFEENCVMRKDSPTVTKVVIRLLFSLAASYNWTVDTLDVTSAFLQAKGTMRDVFVKPPRDIRKRGVIWKLLKPLYGLGDSARRWYVTIKEHLTETSSCEISKLDKSLFRYYENNRLQGVMVTHVDDILHCGTTRFKNTVIKSIYSTFKISRSYTGVFTYLGWKVVQNEDIYVDQRDYALAIRPVDIASSRCTEAESDLTEEELVEYQKLLGKLLWLSSQTRPDLSFDTLEHSTYSTKKVKHLKSLNKVTKKLADGPKRVVYRKLDIEKGNLHLLCFTDASLGNISETKHSASGYIIFLTDGNVANLIAWSSNKVKRVVHSIFAAETLSCTSGTAAAIYIRQVLSEMLFRDPHNEVIPIVVLIDSKQLYDNVHSSSLCQDKRLVLDIAVLQENLHKGVIGEFRWVPTPKMLADCLTKKGVSSGDLAKILETGYFHLDEYLKR
ncbi:uncharacterized protein LOC134818355 [Bolinopsis microptera]|uniref:uncharacterized protein LOC134818355 n=1 Tax=Bolinopsis microptera TaxID=2820187 RepID=UPI003078EFD4